MRWLSLIVASCVSELLCAKAPRAIGGELGHCTITERIAERSKPGWQSFEVVALHFATLRAFIQTFELATTAVVTSVTQACRLSASLKEERGLTCAFAAFQFQLCNSEVA
jgi:hypothetical protein